MGFNYVMNDRNYTNIRRWENDVMEYALDLRLFFQIFIKDINQKFILNIISSISFIKT